MRALKAQYLAELRMTLRQGEQMLVSLAIPLGILIFFSLVDIGSFEQGQAVDYLTPATMALAIMSTAMVSLGIGTCFEREYGVLKRLGATPLGAGRWVLAKIMVVVTIEAAQLLLLAVVGLGLGWRPGSGYVLALVTVLLGTLAFSGLGLTLAGNLRATTNLAVTNGLYLLLLITGGMVVPFERLPNALKVVAEFFPAAPLAGLMVEALGPSEQLPVGQMLAVLAVWAVAMPLIAAKTFRWDPSA
jgi:ABC-2 type transport system permease protein